MKAIINLDKVKYPDVVSARNGEDVLENGAFVALNGLVMNKLGRDCYQIGKLKEGCQFGFVADVALMHDETKDERDFELVAEAVTRVYRPKQGQCITIALKHIDGDVQRNAILGLKEDSYKLQVVEGAGVARVLEKCTFAGQESVYIEFL